MSEMKGKMYNKRDVNITKLRLRVQNRISLINSQIKINLWLTVGLRAGRRHVPVTIQIKYCKIACSALSWFEPICMVVADWCVQRCFCSSFNSDLCVATNIIVDRGNIQNSIVVQRSPARGAQQLRCNIQKRLFIEGSQSTFSVNSARNGRRCCEARRTFVYFNALL